MIFLFFGIIFTMISCANPPVISIPEQNKKIEQSTKGIGEYPINTGALAGFFNPQGTWKPIDSNPELKIQVTYQKAQTNPDVKQITSTDDKLPKDFSLVKPTSNIDIFYIPQKSLARIDLKTLKFKQGLTSMTLKQVGKSFFGDFSEKEDSTMKLQDVTYGCHFVGVHSVKVEFTSSDKAFFTLGYQGDFQSTPEGPSCEMYFKKVQQVAGEGGDIGPFQSFFALMWIDPALIENLKSIQFSHTVDWTRSDVKTLALPACADIQTKNLTVSPIDFPYFKGIVPLGSMEGLGHLLPTDHLYFYHNEVPGAILRSPMSGRITKIILSGPIPNVDGQPKKNPDGSYAFALRDYKLNVQSCQEITLSLAHVHSLATEKSAFKNFEPSDFSSKECDAPYFSGGSFYVQCHKDVNISVKAGDTLGSMTPKGSAIALDVGLFDQTKENNFVNKNHHSGDALHAFCMIDYYTPGKTKNLLLERLGDYTQETLRTIEPRCGTLDIDTHMQGFWFWAKSSDADIKEDQLHLALASHAVDPNIQVLSVGIKGPVIAAEESNPKIVSQGQWGFFENTDSTLGNAFNPLFAKTNPDVIYCFEAHPVGGKHTVMDDKTTLTFLAKFTGIGSNAILTLGTRMQKCADAPLDMPQNSVIYKR